jgi:uncharacterized protein (DUF2141 family)
MKTIITITLSLVMFIINAQTDSLTAITTENGSEITVTVPTASSKGKIVIGLHDADSFVKSIPLQGLNGEIIAGKAVVTFKDIAPGTYGIIIFHDKNDNNKMDFELNGMPIENYGASNNVMSFGPPKWTDLKFEVTGKDLAMEIRL